MSNTTPILQEEMEKRRIMKRSTTVTGPKFQTRFFVLYKDTLVYKTKNKKDVRGSISVLSIKTCEDMSEDSFNRQHVFQVGYLEKGKMYHLYISAKDDERREVWKTQIRKLCSTYNDHRMQSRYHPGHFKKSGWICCKCADKQDVGCKEAFSYESLISTQRGSDRLAVPKTPLLRNTLDSRTFVRMPSDCYDDSDELDDYFNSPSPKNDILQDPRNKEAQQLSSSSMRTSPPIYYKYKPQSSWELGTPRAMLSQSTPNYCPLTQRLERARLDSRLYSISSMTAQAGSERYDSLGGHSSRLDSQGSTIGSSSVCESIPRTESDYQRRIEEGDMSAAIYTTPSTAEGDTCTSTSSTAQDNYHYPEGGKSNTMGRSRFYRDSETRSRSASVEAERTYSGEYVNTRGFS